jgi:phage tail protein X
MSPRIFISAVSSEFAATRQLVANVLTRLGYEPVWQDIFGTEPGDLRQMLRYKIDGCDGLIQLVGHGYGAEPPTEGPEFAAEGFPRVSYTQFEFLYARSRGKKTWLIFTDDGCTRDKPLEELDHPDDPRHPDPVGYQVERQALQQAWCQRWKRETHLFHGVSSNAELELKVERLRDEFAELRRAERAWRRKVAWALAAVASLVMLSVGVGMYVARQQQHAVKAIPESVTQKTAEQVADAQQKTEEKIDSSAKKATEEIKGVVQEAVHELTNPVVLAERIRKEIHTTAEEKIKALPDEKGRGRLIAEIEKERDISLGRVDDLIKLIQDGLKEGASPVFQRAAEILQKEGTDAALEYLESRRPSELEDARRHAERAKSLVEQADAEKQLRNSRLQSLMLEAELLETKLQWKPALQLREQVAELAPDWFEARITLGMLHYKLARFQAAEPLLRESLKLAGNSKEETWALNELALLLQATNRLADAEPLMRRALAIDEQSYGAEHPNVGSELNNLAWLLKETNRLAEAEPLMRRGLSIEQKSKGAGHPSVANCLNNLAQLLQDTNRLAEAEPLMHRALAIDEQVYGADHPKVAVDLNNLAQLLKATNRLAGAEPLMRRALAIDEQSFGAEHPCVARDLNNLASLLQDTNRLAEAEPVYRRALAIDEQSHGADHPNVARDLNNLAQLLKATNRLAEAEPLMRHALAIVEHSYGAGHPRVAIRFNNLALLLQATNRLAEAEPLMRRALAIDEQSYGAEHPNVARVLNNLAQLLQATHRLAEAEPLMRRALAIEEQSYGVEHPYAARHLSNLAQLLQATNRLAEAEPLMRRALAIDEESYGAEHPRVAVDLNNLAQLLQETNRLAEAEPLMRQHVVIFVYFTRRTGHEHPHLQAALANYHGLLESMKLPKEKIKERLKELNAVMGRLKPIVPEVERLLGPAEPVADVLAALDRQYKADGKPDIYFLKPDQPIAPHLDELCKPSPESLNFAAVSASDNGDHAGAIVLYEESLKLLAGRPDDVATAFTTRMNRAAALRELGELEQARDELRKLLAGLREGDTITALAKGRARFHLALCEWRLNDRDAAEREAEESLKEYGDDEAAAPQKKQTEQLLADLKENKPLPPLAKIVGAATAAEALEQARSRFQARADLAKLPLNQSALPLLDKILGPARSTKEVFETLDEEYRKAGKPRVWFLPLNEPIAPHLDELLGPPK